MAPPRFGSYPGNCYTLLGVPNEEVSTESRQCPSPGPTQTAVHRNSQSACPRWHPIRTRTPPQSLAWAMSRRRCRKLGQQAGGAEADGSPRGFSRRRPCRLSAQAGSPAALRDREAVFWIAEAGFLQDEASLLCGVPKSRPQGEARDQFTGADVTLGSTQQLPACSAGQDAGASCWLWAERRGCGGGGLHTGVCHPLLTLLYFLCTGGC